LVSETERTDEEAVRLIVAGDADEFALIYERYYSRAFRMAYGMTGERAAAEDLTQEIFMRVFQKLSDFRGEAAFSTWFYRLAVNQSLNYRRSNRVRAVEELTPEVELGSIAREVPGAGSGVLAEQIRNQVQVALLALKPKLRIVVILKDIEGLSYEEISKRTGCSMGTIASRLNRSRRLLARKLEHLKGVYQS
jgi:RNA polymerase sigma-70 factor (ECF subfamily)